MSKIVYNSQFNNDKKRSSEAQTFEYVESFRKNIIELNKDKYNSEPERQIAKIDANLNQYQISVDSNHSIITISTQLKQIRYLIEKFKRSFPNEFNEYYESKKEIIDNLPNEKEYLILALKLQKERLV